MDTISNLTLILNTIVVSLAIISGIIYAWACCKTRPLKIPTVALTILLWMFALVLTWQLYIFSTINSMEKLPNGMSISFMVLIVIGYSFFLYGSFKDHTMIEKKR